MRKPGKPADAGRGVAALVLLILVLLSGLSLRFHLRFDLSADRTNSPGFLSRSLVDEVPERVWIRYYISPLLAARDPGPGLIENYLRNLAAISAGKIVLEVLDPASNPGEAEKAGLASGRINIIEENQNRQAVVHSGILIEYLDRTRSIPFIVDASAIESIVVRSVRAVISDRDPTVAILVGDNGKSLRDDYSILSGALAGKFWNVVELAPGQAVPETIDVLLVLGNSGIDAAAANRIRDWISAGGKAFFAVKGIDIEAEEDVVAVRLRHTDLLDLLEDCGVSVGRSLVLDRTALTVPFQTLDATGGEKIDYFLYPHWIIARPENAVRSGGMIGSGAGLDLFWPSPLEKSKAPDSEFHPLVMTGKNAWLQTRNFVVAPGLLPTYETELESTKGQYVLAALAEPILPGSTKRTRIIVVGSSDFSSDLTAMTGSAFNTDFVLHAIENLARYDPADSGAGDASEPDPPLRDRRFSRAEDTESAKTLIRINYAINLFLIPLGILAFAAVRMGLRKRMGERDMRS